MAESSGVPLPGAANRVKIGLRMVELGSKVSSLASVIKQNSACFRLLGQGWKSTLVSGVLAGIVDGRRARIIWDISDQKVEWTYGFKWFKDSNIKVNWIVEPQQGPLDEDARSDTTEYPESDGGEGGEEVGAGAAAVSDPAPARGAPTLQPNGQKWEEMANDVPMCNRASKGHSTTNPMLNHSSTREDRASMNNLAWFKMFWPPLFTVMIVNWTNAGITNENTGAVDGQINEEILFRFLGILIGMAIMRVGAKRDCWTLDDTNFAPPIGLTERHGMSRNR